MQNVPAKSPESVAQYPIKRCGSWLCFASTLHIPHEVNRTYVIAFNSIFEGEEQLRNKTYSRMCVIV